MLKVMEPLLTSVLLKQEEKYILPIKTRDEEKTSRGKHVMVLSTTILRSLNPQVGHGNTTRCQVKGPVK